MQNRPQSGGGPGGKGGRGGRPGAGNNPNAPAGVPQAPGGRGNTPSGGDDKVALNPRQALLNREDGEWKEKVIQIRRVTKVVKGGKKMSFRAVVVVGNGEGKVGIGVGKSNEVVGAIGKGVAAAMGNIVVVPIHNDTIPHLVEVKSGGARVLIRPASKGTGVIAGGAIRAVVELSGVKNILSKSLGSNSPLNMAWATMKAFGELRSFKEIANNRGLKVQEMLM
jgi:small subunit ribosomal protein S5